MSRGPGAHAGRRRAGVRPQIAVVLLALLGVQGSMSPVGLASEPVAGSTTSYADVVLEDAPSSYWRFGETTGTTVADQAVAGTHPLTLDDSVALGAQGAVAGDTAAAFAGGTRTGTDTGGPGETAPQVFTVEAWIRTTSTAGGRILGSSGSDTGPNGGDRHLYLTADGRLGLGVYDGRVRRLEGRADLDDGAWHHVAATLGDDGMVLFTDGLEVARRSDVVSAEPRTGWWRVGGGAFGAYPSEPTADALAADLDEVAVYPTALGADRIGEHYRASGRVMAAAPDDRYGAAVHADAPDAYWRFAETTGTRAASSGPVGLGGTYSGTPVLGSPGLRPGSRGLLLNGSGDIVTARTAQTNPQLFSLELWFRTDPGMSTGGRLIGFGGNRTGLSGQYDRAIYMTDDGKLVFGVFNGGVQGTPPTASYNDGHWHHVVAVHGPGGRALYVDGAVAASGPETSADGYTGYWRVGGDNIWDGASSRDFLGSIDEVAIYPRALASVDVEEHHQLGTAPGTPPSASFTEDVTELAVALDGAGSTDPDPGGSVVSYAWDFGDTTGAAASPSPTASHTYATAGRYDVTLTVTDDEGGTTSTTRQVVVNATPSASFTTAVTGLRVDVDGGASSDTDADGAVATYAWDFGDGTTTAASPSPTASHSYAAPGEHRITLTVTDDRGAASTTTRDVSVNTAPSPAFTTTTRDLELTVDGASSADPDPGGSVTSYAWDFGDGATSPSSPASTASHVYAQAGSHPVTLTVTDDRGAVASTVRQVVANYSPTASFTTTTTDLAVQVDGTGSSDAALGSVVAYAWDFGDGERTAPSPSPTASHTYAAPGSYTVTLTVTDDQGATGVVTLGVVVNDPPEAAFARTTTELRVEVDGTDSSDASPGSVVAYAWTFGDGGRTVPSPSPTASHTYAAPGSYTVTLTVTDGEGASSSTSHVVVVNSSPSAAFTAVVDQLTAALDGSASQDPDGPLTSHAWDFGDGGAGDGPVVSHAYALAGTYQVTLTVTDAQGAQATRTQGLSVAAPPVGQPPVLAPPVIGPPVSLPPVVVPPPAHPPVVAPPVLDPPVAEPPVVLPPPDVAPPVDVSPPDDVPPPVDVPVATPGPEIGPPSLAPPSVDAPAASPSPLTYPLSVEPSVVTEVLALASASDPGDLGAEEGPAGPAGAVDSAIGADGPPDLALPLPGDLPRADDPGTTRGGATGAERRPAEATGPVSAVLGAAADVIALASWPVAVGATGTAGVLIAFATGLLSGIGLRPPWMPGGRHLQGGRGARGR